MDDAVEQNLGKGKSSKRWILAFSLLGLCLVAVLVVVTLYLTGVISTSHSEGAEKADKHKGEALYVALDPPFTVNFQEIAGPRFLQVSVEVMTRDPKVEQLLKQHLPMIRNQLVLLFSSQSSEELATRQGKERLLQETLSTIRSVLEEETGKTGVEAVYFTSFVMQ